MEQKLWGNIYGNRVRYHGKWFRSDIALVCSKSRSCFDIMYWRISFISIRKTILKLLFFLFLILRHYHFFVHIKSSVNTISTKHEWYHSIDVTHTRQLDLWEYRDKIMTMCRKELIPRDVTHLCQLVKNDLNKQPRTWIIVYHEDLLF